MIRSTLLHLILLLGIVFPLNAASAPSTASPAASPTASLIAVATDSRNLPAQVSPVGARATYFMLFDASGTLLHTLDNPHKDSTRRTGMLTADFLATKGVGTVIAAAFGGKMSEAIQSHGMEALEFSGTVSAAVKHALEQ